MSMKEIADKIERPVKTYCGGKPHYVERLRMDADDANPFCLSQDEIMEAADYIEALHKELKAAKENAEFHFANYEAMQQQLAECQAQVKAAKREALLEAIKLCENERVEDSGVWEGDRVYNTALEHAARAINSMAKELE